MRPEPSLDLCDRRRGLSVRLDETVFDFTRFGEVRRYAFDPNMQGR